MGADESGKAKRDTQREGERVAETSIRLENGCGQVSSRCLTPDSDSSKKFKGKPTRTDTLNPGLGGCRTKASLSGCRWST